jgi:hypothetical protein
MTYTIDYEGPTPVDDHLKEVLTENPIQLLGYRQGGLFTESHRESLESYLQDEARVEITDGVIAEQTDRLTDDISLTDIIDINFQSGEQLSATATTASSDNISQRISSEVMEDAPTYTVDETIDVEGSNHVVEWEHTNG